MERRRISDKPGGNYFAAPKTNLNFIPSGSRLLDLALGGGWAEQRMANVVGDKSTGKTLLMIEAAANFMEKYRSGLVYYRETEAAFDKEYAAALGLDVNKVDFGKRKIHTVEDFYRDLDRLTGKSDRPELYIIDSLDAISSRAEMDRQIDEDSYGSEKAKKMSELFRRLGQSFISDELHLDRNMTLIIVSQVRDKIGAMFGRKITRAGGRAIDFYASQIVYLSQLGKVHKKVQNIDWVTGIKVKASIDKNKIGTAHREAEFPIKFGWGVDDEQSCEDGLKKIKQPAPRGTNIRDWTEKKWYEIQMQLLPNTKKYGTVPPRLI